MKVYFDNAATTPLHKKAFEKMERFLRCEYGNPSSIHSFGRSARVAVEEARETIAVLIGAHPGEIYFNSGGTEANNFAVMGIALCERNESGRSKVITTQAEHHSVLELANRLAALGFSAELLKVKNDSTIDPELIRHSIDRSTSLVSVIHINNETGSINPIEEISGIVKSHSAFIHTDAVQSFGKVPIRVDRLNIDSFSASGHKIRGPKGIGFAFIRSGTPAEAIIYGGSQERNRRGGTENVAGIVGLAEAAQIAIEELNSNYEHVSILRNRMVDGIKFLDKTNIKINGGSSVLPYILSITFNPDHYNNDAEAILMFLDINGIAASNGAACASGTLKPSHVILAMGYTPEEAAGTIRFSFGPQNTQEEVDYALEVLSKLIKKFRKH